MFGCMFVCSFFCMFTDYSVNCGRILKILFLYGRVCSRGGPIATKSESDEGIPWKSRENLKFYRHTYSDLSIFYSNSCICTRKAPFSEVFHRCDSIRHFNMVAKQFILVKMHMVKSPSVLLFFNQEISTINAPASGKAKFCKR